MTADVALKEWAVVVEALASGEQLLIIRKGGIRDPEGAFQLEHREFFLYPTLEHQNQEVVRPEFKNRFPGEAGPQQVPLKVYAGVAFCAPISGPKQMAGLEKYHIWTPEFFQKRMEYKPAEPALLVVLRAYRLTEPVLLPVTPEYAGCVSWVKLAQPVQAALPQPVIDNRRFRIALEEIAGHFPLEKKKV